MKLSNIFLVVLFIIVLIQAYVITFSKKDVIIEPFDDSEYVERIHELEVLNDSLLVFNVEQNTIRDTIIVTKERVKTIYLEKYIYINVASHVGLDSIIRAGLN